MEETKDEEAYTLTSFEPLTPEQEKPSFMRFVEGFKRKKLVAQKSQEPIVSSKNGHKQVPKAAGTGTLTQYNPQDYGLSGNPAQNVETTVKSDDQRKHFNRQIKSAFRPVPTVNVTSSSPPNPHSRTPSSVLRRLSVLLLAEKFQQEPKPTPTNFKQYWMPDQQCKLCYECGVKFHTFRRRHHCRLCGQIFCSQCCNEELGGHQIGYAGLLRVCVYCKKIVLAYTSGSDIDKNIKQLREDLNLVVQEDNSANLATPRGRAVSMRETITKLPFDALGVSPEEANLLKQDSFKELWQEITAPKTGLELQTHRVRLRAYSNCLVGRELVSWLLVYKKAPTRSKALQICQGLLDCGWIEPLATPRQCIFKDEFILYVPGPSATGEGHSGIRSQLSFHESQNVNTFEDVFHGKQSKPDESMLSQSSTENHREGFHKSKSTSGIKHLESYLIRFRNRSSSCDELFLKVNTAREENDKTSGSENTYSPVLDHFVRVENCYVPKRLAQQQQQQRQQSQEQEQPVQEQEQGSLLENGEGKNEDRKSERVTADDLNASIELKDNEEKEALDKLCSIHQRHISSFLVQLLDKVGLSQSWKEVIEPLALVVSDMVVPDVASNDDMDIRQHVKVKKIPGGEKSDCRIVKGVVCTKNVVHKRMARSLTQPSILMLSCPVAFQRVENKMASLDPILLQEEEFLKNYVARIGDLKPTLVLVEKTVSRLAQEMLLKQGISVILNVKPSLMSRISRCTQGDVLLSLDQGSRPRLGTCQSFKIQKFIFKDGTTKTLAFFEGCMPRFGSTIVLRGGDRKELGKVRNVLKFLLFVAYNSKLEKAFIMDEFGTPFEREEGSVLGKAQEGEEVVKEGECKSTTEVSDEGRGEGSPRQIDDDDDDDSSDGGSDGGETRDVDHINDGTVDNGVLHSTSQSEKPENGGTMVTKDVSCSAEKVHQTVVVTYELFEKILDDVILCSSPLITYPVPYILTSEGQRSELLTYMASDLYWSPMFSGSHPAPQYSTEDETQDDKKECESPSVIIKETHPFVFVTLNTDKNDMRVQSLLANYRAEGGKIAHREQSANFFRLYSESASWDFADDAKDLQQGSVKQGKSGAFNPERGGSGFLEDSFHKSTPSMRDCFDPFLHQSIAILFSSYSIQSANFPRPCISPWTVFMEFYAKNDIALGCFLEKYCFRSSYHCPNLNCDVPMVKHVRYFAHGEGAVYINMKNLESPIPGFSKTLLTWSWCKRCKQVTPVVPVSPEAWRLSFAKYLELRMYGVCYRRRHTLAPCAHSLHQDHYQYFAFNNIVASFKYVPVTIFAVSLPPAVITLIKLDREPEFWIKHIQAMTVRIHHLVNSLNDRIASLKTESFISRCVTESGHDKGQLYEKIKVLENKAMLLLHPPSSSDTKDNLLEPHEVTTLEYEILDGLTLLKRKLCEFVEKWNSRLLELFQQEYEKKKYKSLDAKNSSSSSSTTANNMPAETSSLSVLSDESVFSNQSTSTTQDETGSSSNGSECVTINSKEESVQDDKEQSNDVTNSSNQPDLSATDDEDAFSTETDNISGTHGTSLNTNQQIRRQSQLWATLSREVKSTVKKDTQLQEDRPAPKMKKFISQLLPGVAFQSLPCPFPVHEHHLLPRSEMIPIVVNEKEITSIVAYTLSTVDYHTKLHSIQDTIMEIENDKESYTCIDIETDGSFVARKSSSRTRSCVEAMNNASLLTTLDDYVDDYFKISDSEDEDSPAKVSPPDKTTDTNEKPSNGKSDEDNDKKHPVKEAKKDEDATQDGKEQPHTLPTISSSSEDVEYHIRHSFSDSQAKFFCVVYFAEQFRRIRKAVFPDGEEKYIRSLQYCLHWQATGGKSGSSFCKTNDDRFVIKEMSRPEAQSFLNIAPYYFEYIEKAIQDNRQTLLAKILGVYRIGCTSKLTSAPIRKDILVMDNLLYNCKVDKVFDLKGSVRSRYVMLSENENSVLMDENLLEFTAESPLFIRPHTKAVLLRAIKDDTEFLAKHMVMDYSLLLGIETGTSRLVVGIIDFIRTFTWDKKLEMYVKSTGILGGQGKMPTVVSPRLYRERFCEAMQRYFLMIPSKWMALGNELK